VSRDDMGRLGGSHLAEEMRAIVPGYQSAAATTASRGARSTRQLRACTKAAADGCYDNSNNNNTIQSHVDIIYSSECDGGGLVEFFFTRLPLLLRISGNWNRRFSAFSAIFLNPLTGAHAAGQLRPMAVARSATARPGKPASQPPGDTDPPLVSLPTTPRSRFPGPRVVVRFPVVVF